MKLLNYGAWLSILVELAEIDKRLKNDCLTFVERIDLTVKRDKLRDRFWDITQGGK